MEDHSATAQQPTAAESHSFHLSIRRVEAVRVTQTGLGGTIAKAVDAQHKGQDAQRQGLKAGPGG